MKVAITVFTTAFNGTFFYPFFIQPLTCFQKARGFEEDYQRSRALALPGRRTMTTKKKGTNSTSFNVSVRSKKFSSRSKSSSTPSRRWESAFTSEFGVFSNCSRDVQSREQYCIRDSTRRLASRSVRCQSIEFAFSIFSRFHTTPPIASIRRFGASSYLKIPAMKLH